jgi:acetyl esterase/lipase
MPRSARLITAALASCGCLAAAAASAAPAPVDVPSPPVTVPAIPLLPPGAEPHPNAPPPPPPAARGCRAAWVWPLAKPGPGVSKTALGRAIRAYEVGRPLGRFLGRPPRGIMLLIHGGGWYLVGPGTLATERRDALRWRRRGWLTVNIDYPACARSLAGVLWFHDRVRARLGRRLPLCAEGASAGAHLALMLAARRRDVACVIGLGAPTDLLAINRQASASGSRTGSRAVGTMARNAFGRRRLAALSPVRNAGAIHARLLLATARRDIVIPLGQARAMRDALRARHRYAESVTLGPGPIPWVHANVSRSSLARFHAAERRLVAPLHARGAHSAAAGR